MVRCTAAAAMWSLLLASPRLVLALLGLFVLAAPVRAQWVETGGPPGGSLSALAAPEGALLASNAFTSLRYSGGVWASVEPGLGEKTAGGLRVLARTDDGLALSTDAGATFSALPTSQPFWRPLSIDGGALFAQDVGTSADSLHVSIDDGATWTAHQDSIWVTVDFGAGTDSFPVQLTGMVAAVADPSGAVLVAGTAYVFGGVYRHAPGDTAWVPLVQPGAPGISASVQPYSLVRHGGALWFAHSRGVHRSLDGGTTWADVSADLPASGAGVELYAGAIGLVARSRTTGALARWDGAAWTPVIPPPVEPIEVAAGDALYISTPDRVYAFDGAAWTALPAVVASSPVPVDASADALLVASGGRLLRSTDAAASWSVVLNGATGPYSVAPGRIVAGTAAGLRRSTDGGATWTATAQPALPPSATTTRPTALVAQAGALVATYGYTRTGKHGVPLEQYGNAFRSLDGGASWTAVPGGLPAASLGTFPVTAAVSFPGSIVAVTAGGCVRLADGAASWANAACPPGAVRETVAAGADRLVRTETGLAVSFDDGATWQPRTAGLPVPADPFAFWNGGRLAVTAAGLLFVADPGAGAGSGAGVRAYRLDGDVWTELDTTFPAGVAWSGFAETPGGTLYGGSFGRGLWRAAGTVADAGTPGAALRLDAPHPNPARGAVRVRFALPTATVATLTVLDVLGRRVAVLADGALGAGDHEALWEPGAAAGTYVLRLTTPERVVTRPVTVVR